MSVGYTNPVCKDDWRLGTACGTCERCVASKPPPPPVMRKPLPGSIIPSTGSMLVVLVFIAGVAVGVKLAGGW